jgi:hypothetical protein
MKSETEGKDKNRKKKGERNEFSRHENFSFIFVGV